MSKFIVKFLIQIIVKYLLSKFLVLIVDVPEKPVGPMKIFDITKDSVTLTWKPPGNDGGAPITGYNIEYRDVNKPTWDRAGSVDSTTLSWKQTNLLEDSEYVFRVTAVNRKGESAPLELQGTVKLKKSALGLLILCCFMVLLKLFFCIFSIDKNLSMFIVTAQLCGCTYCFCIQQHMNLPKLQWLICICTVLPQILRF